MKIWFGTTTLNYKTYKTNYLRIRKYLLENGHVLTDDWIGNHGKWIEENPNARRDIKKVYEKVLTAIDEAEISVIEFTVPNFSTSHQITYSLQKRKPTLVLRMHSPNQVNDSYIDALDSPYLSVMQYNLNNLEETISEFLNYQSQKEDCGRYNVMLSKKQKYYLDWSSNKYSKSRSEIIRELINSAMSNDKLFKNQSS